MKRKGNLKHFCAQAQAEEQPPKLTGPVLCRKGSSHPESMHLELRENQGKEWVIKVGRNEERRKTPYRGTILKRRLSSFVH